MTVSHGVLTRTGVAAAAGVEPQALSNWVRRHSDFPMSMRIDGQECYPVGPMAAWLDGRRIPRHLLRDGEPAGTTYGQRFKNSLGLKPAQSAHADPKQAPEDSTSVLERGLWRPVRQCKAATEDPSLHEELVVAVLYLRGRHVECWPRLVGEVDLSRTIAEVLASCQQRHACFAEVLRALRATRWSNQELKSLVDAIGHTVQSGMGIDRADDQSRASGINSVLAAVAYRFSRERFAALNPNPTGGEYFTPPSVASTIVELVDPAPGDRIYDPCCGTGELLVEAALRAQPPSSTVAVEILGAALRDRSWRLATLNAAMHHVRVDIGPRPVNPLLEPDKPEPRHDVIVTNPPFNTTLLDGGVHHGQPQRPYGPPSRRSANYGWLQHISSALSAKGRAAILMPNIASTSDDRRDREIRARMIDNGVVRCMIALPPQLFHRTQAAATVWLLGPPSGCGEILFIDASSLGAMVGRSQRALTDDDRERIVGTYRMWRASRPGTYRGEARFAAVATYGRIAKHHHQLSPSIYVSATARTNTATAASVRDLREQLAGLRVEAAELDWHVDHLLDRVNETSARDSWTH